MANTQKVFALVLGIVLALLGILGFISNGLIGDTGYFGTNWAQDILHLIAGAFGIYAGTSGKGYGYNATIGWIGIILGILGFIPSINDLLLQFLNINTEITVLHLAVGIIALIVYYSASK
ncbi:DUF4383 domain-containing protein [Candidatus Pacearchaeota archaeon]|nr:DUF4383 domain-containing protein [Candidatus Pacearchaeota archaeon]